MAHTMNQEVFSLLDVKAKHIIHPCHDKQNLSFLIVCSQQHGLMIGRETRNTEKSFRELRDQNDLALVRGTNKLKFEGEKEDKK